MNEEIKKLISEGKATECMHCHGRGSTGMLCCAVAAGVPVVTGNRDANGHITANACCSCKGKGYHRI